MANRPFFYLNSSNKVRSRTLDFDWFPGFSVQQKQKSILSLHQAIAQSGFDNILEVSSKSSLNLGVQLSAFNLKLQIPQTDIYCSVESAFQGSKVFKNGGPSNYLFGQDARTARATIKSGNLGVLIGFDFGQGLLPLQPVTAFYDWLYINAILQNAHLHPQLIKFDAFTDIEFNPKKSFNCQAFSSALFVSIYRHTNLTSDISFDRLCHHYPNKHSDAPSLLVQNELF
jgi:hypothetical protein